MGGKMMRRENCARERVWYADFQRIKLKEPPSFVGLKDDDEKLKEWVWRTHRKEILAAMSIKAQDEQSELERTSTRLALLDTIAQVQRQFLQSEGAGVVFGCLLECLLNLMKSEYGFIGEVKYEADGTMFLQTHAVTNIAWDAATRAFYEENAESGLKFYNLNSLFGTVMTAKEVVISNSPKTDRRACGIPKGHPPLNHFLGIPFFNHAGEMCGMVGIANKPGGYSMSDVEFLEPFTITCSNLIQAYGQMQRNKELINTLEQKVKERTRKLELANMELEAANQQVLCASAAQLQHFACMSHEIRTPLNCIIGLSSLLQESDLSPSQKDSVKMIVASGDLLLTVVNDVLDYSKLESGNVDIDIRPRNLQDTLNSVVRSIEMRAVSKKLTIRTNYGTNVPEFLTTDSRRLQQILYNLLGNAVKFSHKDGFVDLSVSLIGDETAKCADEASCPFSRNNEHPETGRNETDSPSRCPFQRQNKAASAARETSTSFPQKSAKRMIRFGVKDWGKGIEEKYFDSIFQPFKQGDKETEVAYGGTGLGLAITAKLVSALGGTISVDSVHGEWTEFSVDLPFTDPPADICGTARKLQDTTVFLVANDPSKLSVTNTFDEYRAKYSVFPSMTEMKAALTHFAPGPSNALIVQEHLYDEAIFAELSKVARFNLLTFGPKFSLKNVTHFQSLLKVLPSVLMESIAACIQQKDVEPGKISETEALSSNEIKSPVVRLKDLRVLVAEDNRINQKVLVRMLKERIGIEYVRVVDNGLKAVNLEAEEPFDVVLMDLQMPVLDGMEATRRIRSRETKNGHGKALVVFVTAQATDDTRLECRKAGGSGFLPKPFKAEEIEKCLKEMVRGHGKDGPHFSLMCG